MFDERPVDVKPGRFVVLRRGTSVLAGDEERALRADITVMVEALDGDRFVFSGSWGTSTPRSAQVADACYSYLNDTKPGGFK
jgi:hypothetical protein